MQFEGEERAIVIHVEGEDPEPWLKAFRSAFPHRRALPSDKVDARAINQVAVAVVWAPPPGFLGQFPNLKQVVSIGAGLDHLNGDPSRPLNVPVLPRQEPASIRTMAEFVLTQVLLHHRRMADSQFIGQRDAGYRIREARSRAAAYRFLGLGRWDRRRPNFSFSSAARSPRGPERPSQARSSVSSRVGPNLTRCFGWPTC